MKETIFLKLGGSLITDKDAAHTALIPQIDNIATQLKQFINQNSQTQLLLGHGSGSFAHIPARRYHTRQGVKTKEEWQGFAEVWFEARSLNQILIERLHQSGLPVVSFPLSASAISCNGQISDWNIAPIQNALTHGLVPVVYGDVIFDDPLGGTIFSTEELFIYLVPLFNPTRILLAGLEDGVWQDYPNCTSIIPEITPQSYDTIKSAIFGSASVDVTGGMASKVSSMLQLITLNPTLQVNIFSGKGPQAIYQALIGETLGTVLKGDRSGGNV